MCILRSFLKSSIGIKFIRWTSITPCISFSYDQCPSCLAALWPRRIYILVLLLSGEIFSNSKIFQFAPARTPDTAGEFIKHVVQYSHEDTYIIVRWQSTSVS
jgi:hypothetical protein